MYSNRTKENIGRVVRKPEREQGNRIAGIGALSRRLASPSLFCVISLFLSAAWPAEARVFHTKESALKLAFPSADRVSSETLVLTEAQQKELEQQAKSKQKSKLIKYYVGWSGGRPVGYAFIDAHVVRSKYETVLVVLSDRGKVMSTHILAFNEPQEYMPTQRWLEQFEDKGLSPELSVNQEIDGISGATLTAYALTASIRRVTACYELLIRSDASRVDGASVADAVAGQTAAENAPELKSKP